MDPKILIVCKEGFRPQYTGGGSYLSHVYSIIPYQDYFRVPESSASGFKQHVLTPVSFVLERRLIRRFFEGKAPPDFVHNNNVFSVPAFPKVLMVTSIHHLYSYMSQGTKGLLGTLKYFPQEWAMLRNSDFVITGSVFTKGRIIRFFRFPEDRIVVIPYGVDTTLFFNRGLSEKPFIVLPNALRYPLRKGGYFVLPALLELLRLHPDLECLITGQLSSEGEAILKALPSNVRYLGFVKEQELSMLYGQALFVLFPSLYEGYGLVPLEVIASGGVPVSSDVGAVSTYLKDRENGLLLPLDQEKWREELKSLYADKQLRESIRQENRDPKIRTWIDCAEDHKRFFEKIVKRNIHINNDVAKPTDHTLYEK